MEDLGEDVHEDMIAILSDVHGFIYFLRSDVSARWGILKNW